MGYGITTNLMYGHYLDTQQSQKLAACLEDFIDSNPEHLVAQACGLTQTNPSDDDFDWYAFFELLSQEVGEEVQMVAQDSDSRIHDTIYEPGFEHGIGVVMAASGYGGKHSGKELSEIMSQGPNQDKIEAYENALGDWIRFSGIVNAPGVITVSNTD